MTLALAHTNFEWPTNAIEDTISSIDKGVSTDFKVENLSLGPIFNLGIGTNCSDIGYNKFTRRFGVVRNNTAQFWEFDEADIVNSVDNPDVVKKVTMNGMFGDDSEGLSDVFPNLQDGGYEFMCSIENGGRNFAYFFDYTLNDMFSTTDVSVTAKQELIMAEVAGTNDGAEGVSFSVGLNEIMTVQEGAISPRLVLIAQRPTNRTTDYDYEVDPELSVSELFDADTILPPGSDLSSCVHHPITGHVLLLSDQGNTIYQYTRAGTLISSISLGLFQAEGLCLHGLNVVAMGEVDECRYLTYVNP